MLLRSPQILLLILLVFTGISCKEDDKNITTSQSVIGEWLRSDASEDFEYTLVFYENNTGLQTIREDHRDGTGISSAATFEWAMEENQLNLELNGTPLSTPFSFTEEGQLLLPGISEMPFDKVE